METDSGHNVLISAGQPLLQALIMLAQGELRRISPCSVSRCYRA